MVGGVAETLPAVDQRLLAVDRHRRESGGAELEAESLDRRRVGRHHRSASRNWRSARFNGQRNSSKRLVHALLGVVDDESFDSDLSVERLVLIVVAQFDVPVRQDVADCVEDIVDRNLEHVLELVDRGAQAAVVRSRKDWRCVLYEAGRAYIFAHDGFPLAGMIINLRVSSGRLGEVRRRLWSYSRP